MKIFQQLLYKMKRTLGTRADFYSVTVGAIDLETGQKTITRTRTKLQRAIIVPTYMQDEFVGTKNLKYLSGDDFLITDEITSIDKNDYFVINTERFNIIDWWELYGNDNGYVFHIRNAQDESPYQVFEESITSSLSTATTVVEV